MAASAESEVGVKVPWVRQRAVQDSSSSTGSMVLRHNSYLQKVYLGVKLGIFSKKNAYICKYNQ